MSTQRPNRKGSNYTVDRWINPQRWEETSTKKEENTKNQNTSPLRKDQNPSPARAQSWTKNDCDEMTELDFRRWIMRNFCELKEHVLNQCTETKNLERRFEEMITRMNNLERNMNELKELKNTTRELHRACTSFNS